MAPSLSTRTDCSTLEHIKLLLHLNILDVFNYPSCWDECKTSSSSLLEFDFVVGEIYDYSSASQM